MANSYSLSVRIWPASLTAGSSSTRKRKCGETRIASSASCMPASNRRPWSWAVPASFSRRASSWSRIGRRYARVASRRRICAAAALGDSFSPGVTKKMRRYKSGSPAGWLPGLSAPIAFAAICSAALRYFSISSGGRVSTSPMLSNP